MKTPKIDRALLAGLVAGLAALSIASTCPHQAATSMRYGWQDCVTCTANGDVPIVPPPGECQAKYHASRLFFCECSPNAKCVQTDQYMTNVTIYVLTPSGHCEAVGGTAACVLPDDWEFEPLVLETAYLKETTGCGSN